jgi:hypothetical protein
MKIEIELSEIETLKTQISELTQQNEILSKENSQYQELNLEMVVRDAIDLMFQSMFDKVCEELGFDEADYRIDWGHTVFNLGQDFYKHPLLKVELEAKIVDQFRRAFLNIGVSSRDAVASKKPSELKVLLGTRSKRYYDINKR